MTTEPATFTVHGLAHLRAALEAGAGSGRPIIALSAPGASAYAGASWFAALIAEGRAEFPDVTLTAILDCGDRAGDALAALRLGLREIVFTGHEEAAERLDEIAREMGAVVRVRRPEAMDLLDIADAARAARKWCERETAPGEPSRPSQQG